MTHLVRSKAVAAVIAGGGIVCAGIAYAERSNFPLFCIGFGYLFVALLFVSFHIRRGRYVIYNLAFVFFSLAIAEYWFFFSSKGHTHYEGPYSTGYYQDDLELGYSVKPGKRTVKAAKKFNDGRTVYDVVYTIDEFGLRATPNVASTDSVFFFGCSFTFGEGVNDADSLPYRYSTISGLRTRNFGLHGYGPHQMLRALETDRPKLLGVPEPPILVVYVALPTHLDRAAARANWDLFGPRYEVKSGKAEYVGPFTDRQKAREPLRLIARYSYVVKRLATLKSRRQHERDRERLNAIFRKSRDLVAVKYAAPFLVVMWDVWVNISSPAVADMNWLALRLKEAGIPVIRLSESLPHLQAEEFYIPFDGHPNGKAFAAVANLIHLSSAALKPPANNYVKPTNP